MLSLRSFFPDDGMALAKLEQSLDNIVLKHKKEDPSMMFERIKALENQY